MKTTIRFKGKTLNNKTLCKMTTEELKMFLEDGLYTVENDPFLIMTGKGGIVKMFEVFNQSE
jgi:hypothetical protein